MRTFRYAIAAFMAVGVGNVFAQQFTAPSQLGYPSYGHPLQARYMEPAPMPSTEPQPPRPVPSDAAGHNGGCEPGGACGNGSCGGCGGCGAYDSCGGCGGCCQTGCCGPDWYIGVGGLFMTRDRNDPVEIAFDPNNIERELLGTQQVVPDDWQAGFEIRAGRYLGCSNRLELVYWTLDPDHASASVTSAGGLIDSALDFGRLDFVLGGIANGVNPWFDNSQFQRISMRSEFHNAEVNLWGDHALCGCCSPLQLSWLAGFRFFRFDESFEYASADQATALGVSPVDDAYYNVDVENNLFGFQIGGRFEYRVTCAASVYADTRVGIYYNHIEQEQRLATGTGIVAVDLAGRPFDIATDKDDFATLAQLDVGVNYQISCNLSTYVGYRLVAASGVANTTDQIPQFMSDFNGIQNIDSNGHLFLHGVHGGVTWRF
jgi:hypothetical protein